MVAIFSISLLVISGLLLFLGVRYSDTRDLTFNCAASAVELGLGLLVVEMYLRHRERQRSNRILRWGIHGPVSEAIRHARLVKKGYAKSPETGLTILKDTEPFFRNVAKRIRKATQRFQGYLDVEAYGQLLYALDATDSLGRGHVRELGLMPDPYLNAVIDHFSHVIHEVSDRHGQEKFKRKQILEFDHSALHAEQ